MDSKRLWASSRKKNRRRYGDPEYIGSSASNQQVLLTISILIHTYVIYHVFDEDALFYGSYLLRELPAAFVAPACAKYAAMGMNFIWLLLFTRLEFYILRKFIACFPPITLVTKHLRYLYFDYEVRDWFSVLKRRYNNLRYGEIEEDSNQENDKPWWIPSYHGAEL